MIKNSSLPYQKKTILQVLPALISGGVERGALEISEAITKNNLRSIVASSGGPLITKLYEHEANHINLNLSSKNPVTMYGNINKLFTIIKSHKVDIIHARSRAPAWSSYFAAKKADIPFVTSFHGYYSYNNFIKKYYNSIMAKGDKVIAVSNFIKNHLIDKYKIAEEKIALIHRGVDLNYFNPDVKLSDNKIDQVKAISHMTESKPIILLPGRITSWKGQSILIEALSKLQNLNCYALIVGDYNAHPNYYKYLKKMISHYNLEKTVRIIGNQPDMHAMYSMADIILSTSTRPEAFGRVAIEAQAMQKLVIATNIGGSCETVIDKETGFHVTPANSDDLAEKLEHCLNLIGTNDYDLITKRAREHIIQNFSLEKMQQKTIELYQELLK